MVCNNPVATTFLSLFSITASVGRWDTTFQGESSNVLTKTIMNYLDKSSNAHSMQTCIVNLSGMGKLRIVHEVARKIITMPMCLRPKETQGFIFCPFLFSTCLQYDPSGFPPPDTILHDWFERWTLADPNEQNEVAKRLRDFVYSLLTLLLNRLKCIESNEWAKLGECSEYPVIPS
jgi:hypothetical protein